MPKAKICGITNPDDARCAVDAGADAIGFVFAESPRKVTPEQARSILRLLGEMRHCVVVGVFVDAQPQEMIDVAEFVGLRVLQLHGTESVETVKRLREKGYDVVKSFRVSAEKDIDALAPYQPDAFLLDSYVPGKPGGTGETFRWARALKAKRYGRIILAGGLGVDNVRQAVETVQPYGVDASSRLETRPGLKDHDLVRSFIASVRSCGWSQDEESNPWPR